MRTGVLVLALAMALALPLAGCLGGGLDPLPGDGDDGTPVGEDASRDASAGAAIEGRVVKDSFDPVPAATVRVTQGGVLVAQAMTDDEGRYRVEGRDAGEHLVQVSAPCCKAAIYRLVLEPGMDHTLNVQLSELPSLVPYVVEERWQGLVACGASHPGGTTGTNLCDGTDPNADRYHKFKLEPGLETVVFAMEWDASSTNLMGELMVYMTKGGSGASGDRFFTLHGPSPLEYTLGPEDAQAGEALHFGKIEDAWNAEFQVWAGGDVVNVVYQQPFQVYYHLYYLRAAPEGASAL